MFTPCEMLRGTVASLSVEGEMLSTNLWEVLWRCFRRGGRELGVAASTVIVYLQVFVFVTLKGAHRIPPPVSARLHPVWHHKALVFTHVPHSTIGTLHGSQKEQQNKRGNEETHTHTHKKQNTSTGNTGQPSDWSGVQLAPGGCTKFRF